MNNLRSAIFILIVVIFVSIPNLAFAKGRSSNYAVTESANKTIRASNIHFDEVCRLIVNNFKDDYQFKNNFIQVSNLFIRMRNVELNMVYRSVDNKIPDYNYYYPTLSSVYLVEMNKKELDRYKDAVNKYCVYGKYYQKDYNACSSARINHIFE